MRLEVSTFLLQWAAGGLLFCWVTTRRREVAIGYGWTLRITFSVVALGAVVAGRTLEDGGAAASVRDMCAFGVAVAAAGALALSVARRRAGVAVHRAARKERAARVAAMTGVTRPDRYDEDAPEFPPAVDLVAPAIGAVGLLAAAAGAGGSYPLAAARLLVGAAFLGVMTDAMLLGHSYLTQPGLSREPLKQLVRYTVALWPLEVALLLAPPGMAAVVTGAVDDGSNGLLGWIWVTSALSTVGLCRATAAALRERWYSAVMAATGLLYLAMLSAFGTDLVARAVLAQ